MIEDSKPVDYTRMDGVLGLSYPYEYYYPQEPVKDQDNYDIYTVQFVPGSDTLNFGISLYIDVRSTATIEAWARCEAYLQTDENPKKQLYADESDKFNKKIFQYSRSNFYNYYNGSRVRFIVRTNNDRSSIFNDLMKDIFILRLRG